MKRKETALSRFVDWALHMLGYSIILLITSYIFKKTMHMDTNSYGLWVFLTAVMIYVLNKTIKPIIFWLTLPITGITMGLFYPFVNVIILNIADYLLREHFDIHGLFMPFLVAIFISILNIIVQKSVIEPMIGRRK